MKFQKKNKEQKKSKRKKKNLNSLMIKKLNNMEKYLKLNKQSSKWLWRKEKIKRQNIRECMKLYIKVLKKKENKLKLRKKVQVN